MGYITLSARDPAIEAWTASFSQGAGKGLLAHLPGCSVNISDTTSLLKALPALAPVCHLRLQGIRLSWWNKQPEAAVQNFVSNLDRHIPQLHTITFDVEVDVAVLHGVERGCVPFQYLRYFFTHIGPVQAINIEVSQPISLLPVVWRLMIGAREVEAENLYPRTWSTAWKVLKIGLGAEDCRDLQLVSTTDSPIIAEGQPAGLPVSHSLDLKLYDTDMVNEFGHIRFRAPCLVRAGFAEPVIEPCWHVGLQDGTFCVSPTDAHARSHYDLRVTLKPPQTWRLLFGVGRFSDPGWRQAVDNVGWFVYTAFFFSLLVLAILKVLFKAALVRFHLVL